MASHRLALEAGKGSQPFFVWTSDPARKFFRAGRLWDALALLAIGFALWKIFIAPRFLETPRAHRGAGGSLPDRLDGGAFRLAQQRGHLAFLDFYASWCEPCKLELPLVERWAAAHPGVMPSCRSTLVKPRATAAAFRAALPLARRRVRSAKPARVRSLPLKAFRPIVVVDGRGYVRAKWEGLNPAIGTGDG